MSNTVPAHLPRIFQPEPKLAAVPSQPTASTREVVPASRTWSFIDSRTGYRNEVTCLPGCVVPHDDAIARGTAAEDVWCMTAETTDLWLPVSIAGQKADETKLLAASIRQDPFDNNLAKRVPHASVEIFDDSFIEALDPDGLATVILALEGQLKQMRAMHARLVELRAQGRVEL
ncbi:DUF6907 domain-containing protein [Streptomyces sp. NPDC058646]|uniref:DUF6907 domain-containing protein n=1 Tax=Streptomyces sp. NPDC058646 TaxID=3346574 RepID=UPI00364FF404